MTAALTPEAVTIGRLRKRIERLQKQRDFWRKRSDDYTVVLNMHPYIERSVADYRARVAERERVKGLEQRIKEQAILIQKLTQGQQS